MTKQEYLKNRFKRDFLQYSLLQEDSLSASKIVDKVFVVFEFGSWIDELKAKIDELCDKYFAFEVLKNGEALVSELPKEFDIKMKDVVVDEYESYLDATLNVTLCETILKQILHRIEQQAWRNGIVEMPAVVDLLQSKIYDMALSYGGLSVDVPSEEDLLQKYEEARKNTLLEKLRNNNIEDIVEYRNMLRVYVHARCMNMMYRKMRLFYERVGESNVFGQLRNNFESLLQFAEELKSSLVEVDKNEDWDREYNKLVPIDFYRRNIEDITPEQAYHMVLLQFFAKNEEWMIENGLLVDEELEVYIGKIDLKIMVGILQYIYKKLLY